MRGRKLYPIGLVAGHGEQGLFTFQILRARGGRFWI